MASEVEKFIAAALLNEKSYGRWNYTELETDCPELVNSVRRHLEAEEAKPSYSRREDVQETRVSGTWRKLTEGGVKRPQGSKEVPLIPLPGLSKVKANYLERKPLADMTECSTDERCQTGVRQLGEPLGRSKACEYPSLSIRHSADEVDYSRTRTSFPSYVSSLKSLDNKTVQGSDILMPRSFRCSVSVPPPKKSSSEPERMRSRSLSAARCLSSDILSPPYPSSQYNSTGDSISSTHHLLQYRIGDDVETSCSRKKSTFQNDYWACALPDFSPPSPDRHSPSWNPHKEYQDLLDYTYPLNPRHMRSTKITRDTEVSEPFLHDSGIDLDSPSASPESTVKSVGTSCLDKHPAISSTSLNRKYMSPPQSFSTPFCKKPGCSGLASDHQHAFTGKVSLREYSSLLDKADLSTDLTSTLSLAKHPVLSSSHLHGVDEGRWCSTGDSFSVCNLKKQSHGFLPTTQVLPLRKIWDSDDEYLSLPESLKELESLAGQLKNISSTAENSGNDSTEGNRSYCLGSKSHLSFEYVEDHKGEKVHRMSKHDTGDTIDYCVLGHQIDIEGIKMDSEQADAGSRLEKLSSIRDMLNGMSYSDSMEFREQHLCNQDQKNESLVQCIKVFCHNLEDMITWLYKAAEVTNNWIQPKPQIESIKSSLELYLKFKKDIAKHHTLTTTVLEIGKTLLQCMSSNVPVLKDALGMIAKQPEELERHADRLYASIIVAMDTIADNSLGVTSEAQQAHGKEFEYSLMLPLANTKRVSTNFDV
ncbi:centrosomal protein of 68 kDa [Microcaecilia unicolor]|uniref:Centrosomal protein of 68 kDa n=1 Tax=Microcaecilia unicolor TaxID=1415580 RepID=A0A6P7X9E1_9AMPH|nr:centrosomal protein of 68 kDa [Microcaecilia unicolor]XP_030052217.1 centrosomal protein of 68 kDa [Microcaecilia unicolor]XP_030052218.1 centrosomal protein of 68 kDa [Microcaecilia unicolor]XP_030052219.1 centrosomal protein of 68 kDa [Microcaecilia unicolor]XP_030052220.1 centrosomal protein of 68 kDa [Microcaecilia unicolor]